MPLSALRRRGSSVFACVLVTSIALASPAHQQQPPPPDEDMPDSWFEGTIGDNLRVRMYVGAAGSGGFPQGTTLWGAYFYTSQWKLIPLDGARLPSGIVRMFEGESPGPAARSPDNPDGRALFDLNLTPDRTVSGTWTSADGYGRSGISPDVGVNRRTLRRNTRRRRLWSSTMTGASGSPFDRGCPVGRQPSSADARDSV
jgi:hypothetical protein